jgi:mRNA interferase RelE/StbE
MAYRIEVERRAQKELARLPKTIEERIATAIGALAETPRPANCTPIQAAPQGTYRLRVGDYRILYVVVDDDKVIVIARVTRRNEGTYRDV